MDRLSIAAGAEEDYTASLQWYAERSRTAAEGFEAEVQRALRAIAADADRFPFCDDRHRYHQLKRYPFQIIYRREANDRLLVVAVAHASRRPGYWHER
jgi:plasmid stabilization system protein ParE